MQSKQTKLQFFEAMICIDLLSVNTYQKIRLSFEDLCCLVASH